MEWAGRNHLLLNFGGKRTATQDIEIVEDYLGVHIDSKLNWRTMQAVVERRMLSKLLSIPDNPEHALHPLLDRARSSFSNRLIQLRCHKHGNSKSFLPSATTLFNLVQYRNLI